MSRLFAAGPSLGPPSQRPRRRPIVVVEDHLYHIDRLLEVATASMPEAIGWLTVVCLDRPGPDTDRAVVGWLGRYPSLVVAACGDGPRDRAAARRFVPLDAEIFVQHAACCRAIAGLLRPGGLLVQDIQLETLRFMPRDRWWESIFLASAIRGTFGDRPPAGRFLSNKRGYTATFGCDLLDAGFDPRDVLDKDELVDVLEPLIRRFRRQAMPFDLTAIDAKGHRIHTCVAPEDRRPILDALDLVLWPTPAGVELAGRAVRAGQRSHVPLKADSHEFETWRALIDDHLGPRTGLGTHSVGRRVAPERAGRAEISNCAARHAHVLRSRLARGSEDLCTVDHAYRLASTLTVGRVLAPPPPGAAARTEVAE